MQEALQLSLSQATCLGSHQWPQGQGGEGLLPSASPEMTCPGTRDGLFQAGGQQAGL